MSFAAESTLTDSDGVEMAHIPFPRYERSLPRLIPDPDLQAIPLTPRVPLSCLAKSTMRHPASYHRLFTSPQFGLEIEMRVPNLSIPLALTCTLQQRAWKVLLAIAAEVILVGDGSRYKASASWDWDDGSQYPFSGGGIE
ncbi:hypothetical protein BT96DRAFT_979366 [Gymnopus androsaceus JB14]|uniref:Uncharacterized protein n=1 Tax=Gymnopus androsaceus JB14 TaxID=1447944 RepID=A0A6A4H547_9AGAR|nr:hypothetical protein BT96DRAFT_979366 [Gymnopus androsaceus JB14]